MSVPAGDRHVAPAPEPAAQAGAGPLAPREPSPLARRATYAVLVLVGVELGMLGSVLSLAVLDVAGLTVPAGPVLAVVTNVAVGLWAARLTGNRAAVAAPAVGWLGSVLLLSTSRPEGDVVITNSGRGVAFLLLGALAWTVAAAAGRWAVPRPGAGGPGGRATGAGLLRR